MMAKCRDGFIDENNSHKIKTLNKKMYCDFLKFDLNMLVDCF